MLSVSGKAGFEQHPITVTGLLKVSVAVQPDHPIEHDRLERAAEFLKHGDILNGRMESGKLVFDVLVSVPADPTPMGPRPESTSDLPPANDAAEVPALINSGGVDAMGAESKAE